jgi:tetratricopeptide (TPR) repeat protein
MLLFAESILRRGLSGKKTIEVDDFKLEKQDTRGVSLSQDDMLFSVVPLEEAIYINDAKTRRDFMMDIIGQDPAEYIELLKKAKFNDDVEVIHYASTAIMEIQRKYELTLHKKEAKLADNPDDVELLDSYNLSLKNYIGSGLIEEKLLTIQRSRYLESLKKRMTLPPVERETYYEMADNLLEMNQIADAEVILNKALQRWPMDETFWMLQMKLCHQTGNTEKRNQVITTLSHSRRHMSAETREALGFWNR